MEGPRLRPLNIRIIVIKLRLVHFGWGVNFRSGPMNIVNVQIRREISFRPHTLRSFGPLQILSVRNFAQRHEIGSVRHFPVPRIVVGELSSRNYRVVRHISINLNIYFQIIIKIYETYFQI